MTAFAVGSLVRARGREWVVLPESEGPVLVVRPLGGSDEEIAGIHTSLETIEPATFAWPTVEDLGDFHSARLLRDAMRLGFRNAAGPFRSFARLACEPRPYQLVPLLMALRQDPVRLLIADDVGIGKTVEACLIARELLDRGEVRRLAVLCPPHLAEQWQEELSSKFAIEAELVLPGTARRLERDCRTGESLFDIHPFVIVSTEFIKSDRHRDDFLRSCPEMVIVDEAHTCAATPYASGKRHQRHQLLKGLVQDPDRHLVLVTATPHSGREDAFRSLLALLDPGLALLPPDLAGEENRKHRERLAHHLVQRRRADIRTYLAADTPFPDREEKEETYALSPGQRALVQRALAFAQELVKDDAGGRLRQRIRWWSALALLRSISSSPAAAVETLRNRGNLAELESEDAIDEEGRRQVMDALDDEAAEGADVAPAGNPDGDASRGRRELAGMAREAEALQGIKVDTKLKKARDLIAGLLKDGFRPIVFCRFIPTAEYVAEELRGSLKGTEVAAVTGLLPPAEREERVLQLAAAKQRVLVCTDCLSEGINLQDHFDAVIHYDLAWNPTRHEQREGRVDRYGQARPKVRVVTLYGRDNPVDGVVIEVLLKKHSLIRNSTGVSVPVPMDTERTMAAIFEAAVMKGERQMRLDFGGDAAAELDSAWRSAAEREKRSRAIFAQHSLSTDEVSAELSAARVAVGSGVDVARFVTDAVTAHGGRVAAAADGATRIQLKEAPAALVDALGAPDGKDVDVRFELPLREGERHLHRTHPFVSGLAGYVLDHALDLQLPGAAARRAGVILTSAVQERTVLLLTRMRYHLLTQRGPAERELLAEEGAVAAFRGQPADPAWLSPEDTERLLALLPEENLGSDLARTHLQRVLKTIDGLTPHLDRLASDRGQELLAAHRRVRKAIRRTGKEAIEPKLPVDVLGLYLCLPVR